MHQSKSLIVVAQLSGALAINAEHQTHASRWRLAITAEHQTHASGVRHTRALAAFLPDNRGVLALLACLLWCYRGRSRQLTILRVFSYFCCCCCCGWYRADCSSGLQELGSLQGKGTVTLYTDSAQHRQASQLKRESTLCASRLATGDNRKGSDKVNSVMQTWAAQYNTWLLEKLTPTGILLFCCFPLCHAKAQCFTSSCMH